jgi:hypothetical protein
MTDTNFRGPANSIGAMLDGTVQPTDGPNYAYQGTVFPDLRAGFFQKDGTGAARIPGFMDNPSIVTVDNIPSASTTASVVAVATGIVSGTVLTLVTVAPGSSTAGVPSLATGVPFIPFGGTAVQNVTVLDFGFTTGTTTAASSAVVVVDNSLFTVGQWLCVGGAGNAGKTLSLLTQVTSASLTNTTSINVFPIPTGSLSNAPIGNANQFNQFLPPATQFGPSAPVATAQSVHWAAGLFRLFNPIAALSRNLSITTTAAAVTGTITARGFDVHGQAMSEAINISTTTAGTFYGKKAFKYVASVTPNYTDSTGSYSVGTGDTFGFPIRQDRYEYLNYAWNGINNVNSTGFLSAVTTNPATATTGDVRGTVQLSLAGAGSTAIPSSQTSNGVARLMIIQTIPVSNCIAGTPNNTAPFFGVTQA